MSIFSSNTSLAQTINLIGTDATKGQKFLKIDDSKLSGGLPKDDKYVATLVFTGNTGAYIKASFIGNLDRSGTQTLPVVSESNYEAATYEILNDSVEVEHLYNLDSEELQMFSTRTANATHTTIELELRNLNDQTFYFTAYFEGYTYDVPLESLTTSSSNFLFGDRGVFGGGQNNAPTYVNTIDYISISSTPTVTASTFGDLTEPRYALAATSDGSRGVFGGGVDTIPARVDTIEYITISTPAATATDFGDLTVSRESPSATSDGSRGVFGGGSTPAYVNTLDYITIASTPAVTATDFGDLTESRGLLAATSDGSRGVFGGGDTPPFSCTLDYITISTPGDATDFGDLNEGRWGLAVTSDGSKGVFGGGYDGGNVCTLEYITISTPGNATTFGGILTVSRRGLAATSDGSRGVFGGGWDGATNYNTIDYITISTPDDAADFGDLTESRGYSAATSGD